MIQEFIRKNSRLVKILAVVLIIVLGYFVFKTWQFHITDITPNNKNYPSSLGVMEINFNRNLNKSDIENRAKENQNSVVGVDFNSAVKVVVDGKKLKLTFAQTPLAGDYSINLVNITAADGASISKKLSFNVKDIDYDKLSDAEKKLYDANIAVIDDERDGQYPILTKLPYEADQYVVSYRATESDPAPTLIITMKFFPPGNNAVPATDAEQAAYLNQLREYRTQALDWIKSQGASLDDYILEYTEPELVNEFPAGRSRSFDAPADTEQDNL